MDFYKKILNDINMESRWAALLPIGFPFFIEKNKEIKYEESFPR